MVDFTKEFYDSDPLPRTSWKPFTPTSSYDSCITDEGYHTDEKPTHQQNNQQHKHDNEIPILKSNRTMYVIKEISSKNILTDKLQPNILFTIDLYPYIIYNFIIYSYHFITTISMGTHISTYFCSISFILSCCTLISTYVKLATT